MKDSRATLPARAMESEQPMTDRHYILPACVSNRACKWTEEDLDRLRLMWAEGVPVGCMAQELGRTYGAIKARLQLLGLLKQGRAKRARAPASASTPSPAWGKHDILVPARLSGTKAPPWTDPELARLRLMWREGMLVDCIARELDRTPGAVQTRATMLGLPKRSMGNGRVPVTARRAPDGLPAGLRYEDDPRAATEFELDRLPASVRGNVTAALMGDPAPGRSVA